MPKLDTPDAVDQFIVDDILRFDFMAQNIWPKIRGFFKNSVAERCSRCVISSKVPGVLLKDGVCNLCLEFNELVKSDGYAEWEEKYVARQRKELDKIFREYQGKGRGRYDAVVLFSGGKDSVYMLSRIRKEYPGLRLLLVTIDNGFYSKLSLTRTKEIAFKMDIDHITYKPVTSVYKTLYRYTLSHQGQKGSYETVDRLDGTLNQFFGMNFAYEMDIPLTLSGVDFAQERIMQFHTYFEVPYDDMCSRVWLDRMERRSGFKIKDIFSEEDQKLFWDGTHKDRDRIPRYICPLIAWRVDKSKVQVQLAEEGLLQEKESTPIVTNNQVLAVMTAIDITRIGYCSFEPEFSKMIRYKENDPVYWRNVFEFVEFSIRKRLMLIKNSACGKVMEKLGFEPAELGL